MRIYNRDDFMALPAGTMFCKGKPWSFEGIDVKGDTIVDLNGRPFDFLIHGLNWIESEDSGQAVERLEEMLEHRASYPMQDSIARDGCFDDDDIFLVYEADDLKRLQGFVETALKQATPEGKRFLLPDIGTLGEPEFASTTTSTAEYLRSIRGGGEL